MISGLLSLYSNGHSNQSVQLQFLHSSFDYNSATIKLFLPIIISGFVFRPSLLSQVPFHQSSNPPKKSRCKNFKITKSSSKLVISKYSGWINTNSRKTMWRCHIHSRDDQCPVRNLPSVNVLTPESETGHFRSKDPTTSYRLPLSHLPFFITSLVLRQSLSLHRSCIYDGLRVVVFNFRVVLEFFFIVPDKDYWNNFI